MCAVCVQCARCGVVFTNLVNACCGFYVTCVATSVSCPVPFCKPQALSDFNEPPASRAKKAMCPPVPAHPAQDAVSHSHWSIAHILTIRTTVPDALELGESLWSLSCPVSQLSQIGCILHAISKSVSTISRHPLLRFVPHGAATTAVRTAVQRELIDQFESVATWRKTVQQLAQPNMESSWLWFGMAMVPIEGAWKLQCRS